MIDVDLNVKLQPGDGQKLREDLNQNFTLLQYEDEKDDARLNREIQDREAADSDLQRQIDAIIQRLDTNEKNIADLQTRMKTTEERTDRLEKIIFGEQYINETERIPIDDSMRPISDEEINDVKVINDDKSDVILHPSDDEPIVEVN